MTIDIAAFLFDTIKMATPLIFAALAALINRHAGMFNMGIEGMILCSALGAVTFAHYGSSMLVGLLGGILVGVLTGLFIGFSHLSGKTDLYLTTIAFNLMATGGTVFVMYLMTGDKSTTSNAFRSYLVPNIDIPLIKDIPFLGRVLSGHSMLTYLAFVSIFLVWFLLYKTGSVCGSVPSVKTRWLQNLSVSPLQKSVMSPSCSAVCSPVWQVPSCPCPGSPSS
ncbi:MAG: hypothetical protein II529_01935 [Erysipelotrichaceae bacterium]|nr:hypothetical protein [Erysipelotrichaceae bacterium]